MLWPMGAHSASHGDVRLAVQAPPWAGLVVIAATAAVIAPMTVTASWTWHLTAAILLTALTAAAITVSGPAPLRTMIYLDVAFLLFALGTHLRWPPVVTTVLVCLLPLAALLAGKRGGRPRPAAPWLRLGQRPDSLMLILAVGHGRCCRRRPGPVDRRGGSGRAALSGAAAAVPRVAGNSRCHRFRLGQPPLGRGNVPRGRSRGPHRPLGGRSRSCRPSRALWRRALGGVSLRLGRHADGSRLGLHSASSDSERAASSSPTSFTSLPTPSSVASASFCSSARSTGGRCHRLALPR